MVSLAGKNVLVTGGTGFIGSHLVEELIKQKAYVTTTFLERDPSSYFETEQLANKVVMAQADVEDFEKIFDLITKHNIEYVFHLAAQPLVGVAYDNPKKTLYSNIVGTINILEAGRLYPNIKAIVVASSDKAYGKLVKNKYIETDPLRGDHPYEVSKSAADLICSTYFKTYDVPVTITRFGNIYGEGDLNYSRIIPGIMRSIIKKEQLQIRSDGKFIRDYLYVKDVVNGYILLAKNIKKIKGEVFNFGSSDTLSVVELIKLIEKTLKVSVNFKIANTSKNEIPYQSLNYSKIKKKLVWRQKQMLRTTIGTVFDWYHKNIN